MEGGGVRAGRRAIGKTSWDEDNMDNICSNIANVDLGVESEPAARRTEDSDVHPPGAGKEAQARESPGKP